MKKLCFVLIVSIGLIFILYSVFNDGVEKHFFITSGDKIVNTNIAELLQHPDKLEGKDVAIIGYLYTGFEMSILYEKELTKKQDNSMEQGVCIDLNNLNSEKGEELSNSLLYESKGTKVLVIGEFNSKEKGHMSSCVGGITAVTCLIIL